MVTGSSATPGASRGGKSGLSTLGEQVNTCRNEIKVLIARDLMVCRRLSVFLLPVIVFPLMLIVSQVVMVIYLAHQGADGKVMAVIVVDPLKRAIPSSLGLFVILGTAVPLGSLLVGRDRFGGALEGLLSTPVSTVSVWLSRTCTIWGPGVAVFFAMAGLSILSTQLWLGDVAGYGAEDFLEMLRMVPVLLIVTFLVAATLVLLLLGGTRTVMVICMVGQCVTTIAVMLWLSVGMVRGSFVDYETVARLETAAIPVLLVLSCVLGRYLLNRQRILGKYK